MFVFHRISARTERCWFSARTPLIFGECLFFASNGDTNFSLEIHFTRLSEYAEAQYCAATERCCSLTGNDYDEELSGLSHGAVIRPPYHCGTRNIDSKLTDNAEATAKFGKLKTLMRYLI